MYATLSRPTDMNKPNYAGGAAGAAVCRRGHLWSHNSITRASASKTPLPSSPLLTGFMSSSGLAGNSVFCTNSVPIESRVWELVFQGGAQSSAGDCSVLRIVEGAGVAHKAQGQHLTAESTAPCSNHRN